MRHILPFLTILILLPAVGALGLGLLGLDRRLHREVSYAIALLVSLGTLGFAIASLATMREHDGGYQLVSDHSYTGTTLGVHWYLGVDGISIFLVLMTALLFPLAIILGRNRENSRAYFAWILLLEAAVMGSFLSLDLLVFFFMFELTLVPAYFIIAGWGHQRRAYAAIKFFLYTFLGSAFLLVGILALAFIHLSQYHYLTFSLGPLMQTHLSSSTEILLFLCFTAAFAVKAPLFPLHTWSPDAYAEAPEEGSVMLAAVLAKLGTYGIIRFDLNLFPHADADPGPAGAHAGRDRDHLRRHRGLRPARPEAPRRLLFAGPDRVHRPGHHRAEQPEPGRGRATHAQPRTDRCRALYPDRLHLPAPRDVAGRRDTRAAEGGARPGRRVHRGHARFHRGARAQRLRERVPGPVGHLPHPPLVGRRGGGRRHHLGDLPALGLPAGLPRRAREADEKTPDLRLLERAVMAPLIILIVFLGVYPKPVLDRINPSVNQLIAHVESSTHHYQPPVAVKGVAGVPHADGAP